MTAVTNHHHHRPKSDGSSNNNKTTETETETKKSDATEASDAVVVDGPLPPENAKSMKVSQISGFGPLGVANVAIGIFSKSPTAATTATATTATEGGGGNHNCQRPSPSSTKHIHVRLITIVVSHYCEKVRWALDLVESDVTTPYYYTEDAHPPGLHAFEPLQVTNGQASITPMVVFQEQHHHDKEEDGNDDDDGIGRREPTIMYESSKILKYFLPSLYPKDIADEVAAKELEFGRRLGPAVRCFAYYNFLNDVDKYGPGLTKICADPKHVSSIESTLFEKFLPRGLSDGIQKSLKITPESSDASLDELRQVFAEVSQLLDGSGGTYLFDEPSQDKLYGFTAADLTFCSLAYPFVRPPEMTSFLSDPSLNPDCINNLSDELQQTTAGKYVLEMYQKHRPVDDGTSTTGTGGGGGQQGRGRGYVTMKSVDRNRTFFDWLFGRW